MPIAFSPPFVRRRKFRLLEKKNMTANRVTPDWLEICVLNDRIGPLYSDQMMLNDTLALVSWRSKPRSFVALMSLYESNYLRLASLAGKLRDLSGVRLSRVADDCDLRLTVTERSPYTTTLDLTYLFQEPAGSSTYPDMGVRIYHDARLAEAQEWAQEWAPESAVKNPHDHEILRRLRSAAERELDQRWARNTMLNKWLEYCIDRGHGFRV
jgi:uncharacterized protein YqiB (DUF1249 family)